MGLIVIWMAFSNMDHIFLQTTFCQHKCIMPSSFNRAKHMSYKSIRCFYRLRKSLNEQVKLIKLYSIYLTKFNIVHTWNFKQWILLWPLYIILWFFIGLAIGLAVPSMNPQHWSRGAPLLCIAWEKSVGSNHAFLEKLLSGCI